MDTDKIIQDLSYISKVEHCLNMKEMVIPKKVMV